MEMVQEGAVSRPTDALVAQRAAIHLQSAARGDIARKQYALPKKVNRPVTRKPQVAGPWRTFRKDGFEEHIKAFPGKSNRGGNGGLGENIKEVSEAANDIQRRQQKQWSRKQQMKAAIAYGQRVRAAPTEGHHSSESELTSTGGCCVIA